MKTKLFIYIVVSAIFLSLSGCGTNSNKNTTGSLSGKLVAVNALQDSDYNDTITLQTLLNSKSMRTSNLNDYVDSISDEPVNLENFKEALTNDGEWVKITQEEIDPQSLSEDGNEYVNESENEDENINVNTNDNLIEETGIDEDVNTEYVWVPKVSHEYEGWNPYCDGRWEWSYRGWVWISNYSWGWAPYHYGRWWYSPQYGWVWSPGYRWAPSWVYWCNSGEYTGWHPISPRWHFFEHNGRRHHHHKYNNNGWVFIHNGNFTNPINKTTIVRKENNQVLLKDSKPFVNLKDDGKKVFNPGPQVKDAGKTLKKDNEQYRSTKTVDNGQARKVNVVNTRNNNSTLSKGTKNTEVTKKDRNYNTVKKEKIILPTKNIQNNTVINNPKKIEVNNNKDIKQNTGIKNTTGNKTKETSTKINDNSSTNSNTKKTIENGNNSNTNIKKSENSEPKKNTTPKENNSTKIPKENSSTKIETTPKVNETPKINTTPKENNSVKINTTPKVNETPKINTPKENNTPKVNTTPKSNNSSNEKSKNDK